MNKKGILGLDTARGFVLLILIVSVIGFVAIVTLSQLDDVSDNVVPVTTVTFYNTTTSSVVNESGALVIAGGNLKDCTLTVTAGTVWNASGPVNASHSISSGNYSVSGCTITHTNTAGDYNNSLWNMSGSYTYRSSATQDITGNVSAGVNDFFSDSGTWFSLLSVVVIILIIGIVIFAVNRFGGGGGGSITTSGGTMSISRGGGSEGLI